MSRKQILLSSIGPFALGLISIGLVYTALYMTFNEVAAESIEGVQGRYFIPLVGLLIPAVLFYPLRKSNVSDAFNKKSIPGLLRRVFVFQSVAALFVVFATNYIPNIKFI